MITGFIGDIAVSIKPETYKSKESSLPETINIELVYDKKTKDGITIEYNF